MSVLGAILLVLAGLAIMAFGIFLFYAWLPFLYGLFGLELGLLLGRSLAGDVGLVDIILGIVSAAILFGAAYFLEPYRRIHFKADTHQRGWHVRYLPKCYIWSGS